MKRVRWLAAGSAALIGCSASAAEQTDPAMLFVGRLIAGDSDQVSKLVLEPVSQADVQPAVDGKTVLSVREFLDAIARCKVRKVENIAPTMGPYEVPADLNVIWDCGRFALAARIKSVAYNVEVSQFQRRLFAPPMPPTHPGK